MSSEEEAREAARAGGKTALEDIWMAGGVDECCSVTMRWELVSGLELGSRSAFVTAGRTRGCSRLSISWGVTETPRDYCRNVVASAWSPGT